MKKIIIFLYICLMTLNVQAADEMNAGETIRLFLQKGDQRVYLIGYHWGGLNLNQKIEMIEQARRGALELNAVMTQPAEVYIQKIDVMLAENPQLRQFELGQVVQGIATSLDDWDTG